MRVVCPKSRLKSPASQHPEQDKKKEEEKKHCLEWEQLEKFTKLVHKEEAAAKLEAREHTSATLI